MKDRNAQPFAQPWQIVEHAESFEVKDSVGHSLAYVYFEDEPTRRDFTKRLSKYDARRMAQQILRLPQLMRIARGIDPEQA